MYGRVSKLERTHLNCERQLPRPCHVTATSCSCGRPSHPGGPNTRTKSHRKQPLDGFYRLLSQKRRKQHTLPPWESSPWASRLPRPSPLRSRGSTSYLCPEPEGFPTVSRQGAWGDPSLWQGPETISARSLCSKCLR